MERTDGTNALPWWMQSGQRWWHAGPGGMKTGESILPPSQTGVVPLLDTDRSSVYVTNDRDEAVLYAAQFVVGAYSDDGARTGPMPRVYEVTFHEEPQPDDTQPTSESSFRVPSATIRRVESVSKSDLRAGLDIILGVHQAQLAAKLVEAAEAEVRDAAGE